MQRAKKPNEWNPETPKSLGKRKRNPKQVELFILYLPEKTKTTAEKKTKFDDIQTKKKKKKSKTLKRTDLLTLQSTQVHRKNTQ